MIILADTGVLLRLCEPTDAHHATLNAAVNALLARGDEIVYAHQNATEFWNVCTRPVTARGGYGLSAAETDRRLGVVEGNFNRLLEPPAVYTTWRRLIVSHAVQGKQVHDARLTAIMLANSVSHILTLNGPDFARYPGITVLDPLVLGATPGTAGAGS